MIFAILFSFLFQKYFYKSYKCWSIEFKYCNANSRHVGHLKRLLLWWRRDAFESAKTRLGFHQWHWITDRLPHENQAVVCGWVARSPICNSVQLAKYAKILARTWHSPVSRYSSLNCFSPCWSNKGLCRKNCSVHRAGRWISPKRQKFASIHFQTDRLRPTNSSPMFKLLFRF